jgi:hypothetical protein
MVSCNGTYNARPEVQVEPPRKLARSLHAIVVQHLAVFLRARHLEGDRIPAYGRQQRLDGLDGLGVGIRARPPRPRAFHTRRPRLIALDASLSAPRQPRRALVEFAYRQTPQPLRFRGVLVRVFLPVSFAMERW